MLALNRGDIKTHKSFMMRNLSGFLAFVTYRIGIAIGETIYGSFDASVLSPLPVSIVVLTLLMSEIYV